MLKITFCKSVTEALFQDWNNASCSDNLVIDLPWSGLSSIRHSLAKELWPRVCTTRDRWTNWCTNRYLQKNFPTFCSWILSNLAKNLSVVKLIQIHITELMEDSIDKLRNSPKMMPQIGYSSLKKSGYQKDYTSTAWVNLHFPLKYTVHAPLRVSMVWCSTMLEYLNTNLPRV